jgi:hypothetical protein
MNSLSGMFKYVNFILECNDMCTWTGIYEKR